MKNVILILGMHRSGTSALTRVVSLMGAALPKSILGKNHSNLRGHWESEVMIKAHENFLSRCGSDWKDWRRLSLARKGSLQSRRAIEEFQEILTSEYSDLEDVCVVKEPRICRFASLYMDALKDTKADIHTVLMVRNPLEVAASLQARDEMKKLDALYLWLTHMLEAELASRGEARSFVSYDTFLKDPAATSRELSADMQFVLPYKAEDVKGQIEAYVKPVLKRQTVDAEDIVLDPVARGWVSDSYEALLVLCANPKSQKALQKLDQVRETYFASIDPLYDVLSHERGKFEKVLTATKSELIQNHETATSIFNAQQKKDWAARDRENAQAWQERDVSHAAAIERLTAEHEAEREVWARERESLMAAHQAELADVQSSVKAELEREREGAAARAAELASEQEGLKEAWARERDQAIVRFDDLSAEHEAVRVVWAREREKLVTAHLAQTSEMENVESKLRAELEQERAEAKAREASHVQAMKELTEKIEAEHQNTIERMNQDISFMRDEFGEILRVSDARADYNAGEARALRQEMSAVLNSTSWKMTGGLRRFLNIVKGIKPSPASPKISTPPAPPRLEFKSED